MDRKKYMDKNVSSGFDLDLLFDQEMTINILKQKEGKIDKINKSHRTIQLPTISHQYQILDAYFMFLIKRALLSIGERIQHFDVHSRATYFVSLAQKASKEHLRISNARTMFQSSISCPQEELKWFIDGQQKKYGHLQKWFNINVLIFLLIYRIPEKCFYRCLSMKDFLS